MGCLREGAHDPKNRSTITATARSKAPRRSRPKEIILVQGLFLLYTRALREPFDVSVWLDPEPELKVAWKILRDSDPARL